MSIHGNSLRVPTLSSHGVGGMSENDTDDSIKDARCKFTEKSKEVHDVGATVLTDADGE